MPVVESRPFRSPAQHSVTASVQLVDPAVQIDDLPDAWEPGQDLILRVTAILAAEFWEETGIPEDEPVVLVGLVTCLAARTKWRATAVFAPDSASWVASVDIEVDGSAIAGDVLVDVAVTGPGRTEHPDPTRAIHRAARLWRLPAAIKVPVEGTGDAFPTSAVSFGDTGRRRVPWQVDVVHDAEPAWGLTAAVRLYVNTDFDVATQILDGTAERWIYQAIQADIYTATIFQLAAVRDGYSLATIVDIAETDVSSLSAFCAHVAFNLGFDLEVAMRLAREEPMQLIERAREASDFMNGTE